MASFSEDTVADPLGLTPPKEHQQLIPAAVEENKSGGVPASTTDRLANEANTANQVDPYFGSPSILPDAVDLFPDTVQRSFRSGDNWAYQLYKRSEREWLSPPPDPTYNADEFIKRNRDAIPANLEKQYRLAESEVEANLILRDMQGELRDKEILERRGGFSTFVASGLAGIVDLDTPLALLSGGMSTGMKGGIMATKWGRVAGSAAFGGMTQAGAQLVAFEAGTTGDWTSIPAAGLGGMAFGILGGALSKSRHEIKGNDAIRNVTKEFDEYVADGAPLAARDIRNEAHVAEDAYGSVQIQQREQALKELEAERAKQAEKQTNATPEDRAKQDAEYKAAADAILGENWKPTPKGDSNGAAKPQVFEPTDPNVVITDYVTAGKTGSELQGEAPGSIGARQMASQGSVATIQSTRVTDRITSSKMWAVSTDIVNEVNEKYSALRARGAAGDVIAKHAARFHDFLEASPAANDFSRLWRTGSIVAQRLAYDIFENASGVVRNNRSSAMLKDLYEKQLLGSFMPDYEDGLKAWAKDKGHGWFDRMFDTKVREAFNRELIWELNSRAHDPVGVYRQPHPGIKAAADAHDKWSELDIEIGRGRPGEHSIKGYENLQSYSGYFSQKWNGSAMQKLLKAGRSQTDIEDAISEAYRYMYKNMGKDDADKYARAVVRRALAYERGADVNLVGILQQDGREFLAEVLRNNNVSQKEVDSLIDKLTGEAATRGQAGHTKGRLSIDMRFNSTNGIQIMDLMDVDVARLVSKRARGTSGAAALARKGITSRMDRADIIDAIIQEQSAKGQNVPTGGSKLDKFNDFVDKDRHISREDLEAMFSYFDAGPIAGGISPVYANIKKVTNLALLNQLGLTQMAEVGVQISSVGLKRWYEHAGYALRGKASDPKSELVKELKHMAVMQPEEKLFRDDFNLEMDKNGPAGTELNQRLTTMLNQGQRLQGYTSGYYAVRNFQQRVAVTSAADKIMQNMAGLAKDLSAERAADIGLDPKLYARIQSLYVQPSATGRRQPIVEFKDGGLHKLNMEKWNPQDAEDFALALNRHVNQVVQKAMAGESNILFHKDGIASLFFHLKSFPMLAMEKQMGRHVRIADGEAVSTFFAGLATAAAAYTAKQAINMRTDNMSLDKIARGAINYSNMTGWLPMWVDPVAGMLGMDSLKFSPYGRPGQTGDILSIPPSLTTLDKMAHIPGAIGHIVTGNKSNNDVRAIQSTPIIGNAYGFVGLTNLLKN